MWSARPMIVLLILSLCAVRWQLIESEAPPADHEFVFPPTPYPVPNIVHQTYDYQSPSFFLYLSLKCVQRYLRPAQHILWVNDEGRFRKGHWEGWRHQAAQQATEKTWMYDLHQMIESKLIDVRFLTFPAHPQGNSTAFAHEKAHRSDFVRMDVLQRMGGIYLDTDAFVLQSLDSLRVHNFTLSFDNIVNPDKTAPKRINNGVLLSAPNAPFLRLWQREYAAHFNPKSFDYDSSVVPFRLATEYPDLLHVEMWRIAPMSFAFQTSRIADAITCGLLMPPGATKGPPEGAIWAPVWGTDGKGYTFKDTQPDTYMYAAMSQRLVLHLTMTHVRGICMLRKALGDPKDLDRMPSLLGRIFRIALYGKDDFDYSRIIEASVEQKNIAFKACRDHFGMYLTPDPDDRSRQQYTRQYLQ